MISVETDGTTERPASIGAGSVGRSLMGAVHIVDEDVASRWGPRVVDFVQQVSKILVEREAALEGTEG